MVLGGYWPQVHSARALLYIIRNYYNLVFTLSPRIYLEIFSETWPILDVIKGNFMSVLV